MAAGKGGGSWKVAYADFVTAMMAFFLVMWIGAQDTKVRQSVANYFVDPSGVDKKPVQTGAVLDSMTYGSMPKEQKVDKGQGTKTFAPGEPSPGTLRVNNWIHTDEKRLKYWQEQAQRCRETSRKLAVGNQTKTPDELAAGDLSVLLRAEFTDGIPNQIPEIHKDLLIGAMNEVNWDQLAAHLLRN